MQTTEPINPLPKPEPKPEDLLDQKQDRVPKTWEEACALIRERVAFQKPRDPTILLLWGLSVQLGDLLPDTCLIHLGFSGPKSSGKTTATALATEMVLGKMIEGITLAALLRQLDLGTNAIGLDEIDAQIGRVEGLEALLRAASRRGSHYSLSVMTEKKWVTKEVNVGVPFVFNYNTEVDDALRSRALLITLAPDGSTSKIVRNLVPQDEGNRLFVFLKRLAADARQRWDEEKVKAFVTSQEFAAILDRFDTILPRDKTKAAVLLTAAHLANLDLESIIHQSTKDAEEEEDSWSLEREALRALIQNVGVRQGWIAHTEALTTVNLARQESKLYALTPRSFAGFLRACGWVKGKNWKRAMSGSERNKAVLYIDAAIIKSFDLEEKPPQTQTLDGR